MDFQSGPLIWHKLIVLQPRWQMEIIKEKSWRMTESAISYLQQYYWPVYFADCRLKVDKQEVLIYTSNTDNGWDEDQGLKPWDNISN